MKTKQLLLLFGVAMSTTFATAQTVTFKLFIDENGPGTFNLYANASLGDNFGLALYGVPLIGTISTLDHNSPNGTLLGVSYGFADPFPIRSLDLAVATVNPTISGGQLASPSPQIYGFGQTAGSLPAGTVSSDPIAYGATLLLASGTYSGAMPNFNLASSDLLASVFPNNTGGNPMAATVLTTKMMIPEPGTLSLLSLGGFALFYRLGRRRWSIGQ